MWKAIMAVCAHTLIIAGLIVWFGRGEPIRTPGAASPQPAETSGAADMKFTGELERDAVIRVLENDTAIKQGYFDELLVAFNAQYAQYGIVAIDANMDQYLDLENDGPYGYGPDVLYQANDQIMKYVDGTHIQPMPVQQLDCFEQIDANAWRAYQDVNGIYYGVPVNIQAPVLYYRKDLLPENWQSEWDDNKNGVPDMIENWVDLYRFSQQRRAEGKYGYMKSLFDVYFSSGYLFSYGGYVFGKNGNDAKDIGFAGGESQLGAGVIKQLAGLMNEDCIDDTITKNQYMKLAAGEYFCTLTTPDVYTLFVNEMKLAGMDPENLATAAVPMLPASGDLTDEDSELIPCVMMGGINGYAVSSYTKSPNASLAFVDFATGFEMIARRNELLGIVPARRDAAMQTGGLTLQVNETLAAGNILIMPSVRQVAQIWTPMQTLFSDLAKDAFRPVAEQKFNTLSDFKIAVEKANSQVYDAIWTLN
jgi:arabinogalactan oligomer/maltooligosaccharide transport system substrate-binding protein